MDASVYDTAHFCPQLHRTEQTAHCAMEPLESMKAPLKPPPIDPKEAIKGHQAGDGIRSMEVLISTI